MTTITQDTKTSASDRAYLNASEFGQASYAASSVLTHVENAHATIARNLGLLQDEASPARRNALVALQTAGLAYVKALKEAHASAEQGHAEEMAAYHRANIKEFIEAYAPEFSCGLINARDYAVQHGLLPRDATAVPSREELLALTGFPANAEASA